jgi:hypothetical protein
MTVRAEDSIARGSRATRADIELPDPFSLEADTDYQHRLLLILGELEASRPQLAVAVGPDQLSSVVALGLVWVGRLADLLTDLIPANDANPAITDALAAAGQFLTKPPS